MVAYMACATPHLLIIWHSRTGSCEALAMAAYVAAGAHARIKRAEDVSERELLAAGGFLFICPENLASMSGQMKEMFDRTYYTVLGQIEGRAYATILAAGSDGTAAQRQIDRIATGWRLRRVAEPLIVMMNAQSPDAILAPKIVPSVSLAQAAALGAAMAKGLELGIY